MHIYQIIHNHRFGTDTALFKSLRIIDTLTAEELALLDIDYEPDREEEITVELLELDDLIEL